MPLTRLLLTAGAIALLVTAALPARGGPATPGTDTGRSTGKGTDMAIDMAIAVDARENRPVSYTNRRSAFYYTQTHRNDHPEHAGFSGWNVAGRRVYAGYRLDVAGAARDPADAQVVVRPEALVRTYADGLVETLNLVDGRDLVVVRVARGGRPVTHARVVPFGETLQPSGTDPGIDWYESTDASARAATLHVGVGRRGDAFLIASASTRDAARAVLTEAQDALPRWIAAREARLASLVTGDRYVRADDERLTRALRWLAVTTDQLVTRQRGDGLYAGLPWFAEYWGRDTFISLAGAMLVTGRFEEARGILESFAAFQELDRRSPFYGRLPNIVKPGSLDYHTTDGTPRWVIALRDYVRYTGDRELARRLYPNVRASIEGSFARFVGADGYLKHADNETWMDARREPDKVSYSPRGTRANDVQALWYGQLRAGAEFAVLAGDESAAQRWTTAADALRARFSRDFVRRTPAAVADRLDAANVPDWALRPNLLFTLDLVDDDATAAHALRTAWEALVYPWGVATLDSADPFFHPYHVEWERWHKDEAYHNGTVWPWLNGIAMQRMIERGQVAPAWELFVATNELALTRGAVGGLSENLDAYPHPGEPAPRLTGTFLQAWSNAEQLRVWYQWLLGVRPDVAAGRVVLAPRVPAEAGDVDFAARLGRGSLEARYAVVNGARDYEWRLRGLATTLVLDLEGYAPLEIAAGDGDRLRVERRERGERSATALHDDGARMRVRLVDAAGRTTLERELRPSAERRAQQALLDGILHGTRFAVPRPLDSHPVMRQVYRRAR
jgi:glycogen debranching enzyme